MTVNYTKKDFTFANVDHNLQFWSWIYIIYQLQRRRIWILIQATLREVHKDGYNYAVLYLSFLHQIQKYLHQILPQGPYETNHSTIIWNCRNTYYLGIFRLFFWCDEIENDKFQSEKELVTFKHIIIKLIIPKLHVLYSISVIYDMVGNILV